MDRQQRMSCRLELGRRSCGLLGIGQHRRLGRRERRMKLIYGKENVRKDFLFIFEGLKLTNWGSVVCDWSSVGSV
jgi:hypothetical protein